MTINPTPQVVIWLVVTAVSTVVGVAAVVTVLHRMAVISARASPDNYRRIYVTILTGNLWQQLLRLCADFLSWTAGIAALFAPPPPPPTSPEPNTVGFIVLWTIVGLRIVLTLNSALEFALNLLWSYRADQEAKRLVREALIR